MHFKVHCTPFIIEFARHLTKKSIQKFHDIIEQEKISDYGFFKKMCGISEMQKNFLDYSATAFAKVYMPN